MANPELNGKTCEPPNWPNFYRSLYENIPIFVEGAPLCSLLSIRELSKGTDMFWSPDLNLIFENRWNEPQVAVREIVESFVENIRDSLNEPPFNLFSDCEPLWPLEFSPEDDPVVESIESLRVQLSQATIEKLIADAK